MRTKVFQFIAILVLMLGFLTPSLGHSIPTMDDCTTSPGSTTCGG